VVDPDVRAFLDWLASLNRPQIEEMEAAEARAVGDLFLTACGGPGAAVARVRDETIAGPRGPLRARIYTPQGAAPFGVLVYFHGGGYVYGSIETHDSTCRLLANEGACIVVSVDYALAPEHKVPAAFEDARAAVDWAIANAAAFDGDPARIAVGGDSAGASLATQVCLAMRDRGAAPLGFQLLVYPGLDFDSNRRSYVDYADGYFLTVPKIRWFVNHYLSQPGDIDRPYVCPLRASDLSGLPPALVIVAECDPLRDEGIEYAQRLLAAGVPARVQQYDGQIHGFFSMLATFPKARIAVAEAGRALREIWAAGASRTSPGTALRR
jgi:acetyl esterase